MSCGHGTLRPRLQVQSSLAKFRSALTAQGTPAVPHLSCPCTGTHSKHFNARADTGPLLHIAGVMSPLPHPQPSSSLVVYHVFLVDMMLLCCLLRSVERGKDKGKGEREFEAGKKLYANMVLHCSQDFVSKYLGNPTVSASGDTSARWEGLKMTQNVLSPETWAAQLDFSKTELMNRAALGLSECAATVLNLNSIIKRQRRGPRSSIVILV